MQDANDHPVFIDRRDAAVVTEMEQGNEYGASVVEGMYKRYTDIRSDRTAKERKNSLFDSPCMEYTGTPGLFVFMGVGDE